MPEKSRPPVVFPQDIPFNRPTSLKLRWTLWGKHSPSVIIETDLEFRRQIIIWHSLLPKTSLSSCPPSSLAFLIWWQRLMEGDRLSLNGVFCPRRFALSLRKPVACVQNVAKLRGKTNHTKHREAKAISVQEGVSQKGVGVISRVSVTIMLNISCHAIAEQLTTAGVIADLNDGSFRGTSKSAMSVRYLKMPDYYIYSVPWKSKIDHNRCMLYKPRVLVARIG